MVLSHFQGNSPSGEKGRGILDLHDKFHDLEFPRVGHREPS